MTPLPVCVFDPSGPLRSPRARLLIAALSAAVLGTGALLRPRGPAAPLTAPKEHSAPLIEEEVQRRTPLRGFSGLQDLGARLVRYTIAMPVAASTSDSPVLDFASRSADASRAAGFGVIVSPGGHAVSHAAALEGRPSLQIHLADGTAADARMIAFEPATGLVLLQVPLTPDTPVPAVATQPVRAGALAAMATRWAGTDTVLPVFVTEVNREGYRFSASGAAVPAGAPIFTLDGEVVAVASGAERPGWAYSAGEAYRRLRSAADAGTGHPPSLGLVFQARSPLLQRVFGGSGVLISDVIEDGPAARAGIEAGDVLTRIGALPTDSLEAAHRAIAALTPSSETVVQLIRDGRPRAITVVAGPAFAVARWAGRRPQEARNAPEAAGFLTREQLRAASIAEDARVLAINGRPVASVATARREMRRRAPLTVLYVQQGQQRLFTVLPGNP